jgi:hypothetical protein
VYFACFTLAHLFNCLAADEFNVTKTIIQGVKLLYSRILIVILGVLALHGDFCCCIVISQRYFFFFLAVVLLLVFIFIFMFQT